MKFINNFKRKFLENNLYLAVLSIMIAIITWFYISLTQYPTIPKTIENIPITLDISGTSANLNGLSVVSCDVKEVTVELLGSRTKVGNLNSENLEAYIDADTVSNAGTKKLSIKIRSDSDAEYKVTSVKPETATIVFDKIETREFEVDSQIPNISVVNGMEINRKEISCEPSSVLITGPSAQLDRIFKCYVVSNKKLSLDRAYTLTSDEIQLYTEDNLLIDQSSLKFSDSQFNITIPVRTQKDVRLSVSIGNTPANFDKNTIKFNFSDDTVTLACNNSQKEIPDVIEIGSIPLYEIKPGFSKTFSISSCLENSEYINISEIETVTVTFDDENFAQTDLTIEQSRFSISNTPDSSYEYKVRTQFMNITVIGSEESISKITAEDIIADVNLLYTSVSADNFNANVSFSCPKYDDVWVVTNAKAAVQRTKIEPTTTEAEVFDDADD